MKINYVNLNYFTTLRNQLREKYGSTAYLYNITQPSELESKLIVLHLGIRRNDELKQYFLVHKNEITPGTFKMQIIRDDGSIDSDKPIKGFSIILPSNLNHLSIDTVLEGCRMADEYLSHERGDE